MKLNDLHLMQDLTSQRHVCVSKEIIHRVRHFHFFFFLRQALCVLPNIDLVLIRSALLQSSMLCPKNFAGKLAWNVHLQTISLANNPLALLVSGYQSVLSLGGGYFVTCPFPFFSYLFHPGITSLTFSANLWRFSPANWNKRYQKDVDLLTPNQRIATQ